MYLKPVYFDFLVTTVDCINVAKDSFYLSFLRGRLCSLFALYLVAHPVRGFVFPARDFLQQVVMNVECDRFFSCVSSLCPGPQRATFTYNHRFCQTSVAEGKAAKLLRVKVKGDYNDGP